MAAQADTPGLPRIRQALVDPPGAARCGAAVTLSFRTSSLTPLSGCEMSTRDNYVSAFNGISQHCGIEPSSDNWSDG